MNRFEALDIREILSNGSLVEIEDDVSNAPLSKRNYFIDGEWLGEWGGVEEFLKIHIKPFIDEADFVFDINEHMVNNNEEKYTCSESIEVNNNLYVLFKDHNYSDGSRRYLTALKVAEVLNKELSLQGFKEQFYLINGDNDLSGAFLTTEQGKFFQKHIQNIYWRPYTVDQWVDLYEIDYINLQ